MARDHGKYSGHSPGAPQTEQGPGYGGAMLAAVACGEYATVQECADKLIKIKSVTEPVRLWLRNMQPAMSCGTSCTRP